MARTANVVGFVYQDDRFGEDEFMVSRFTVSCCVADAAPYWFDCALASNGRISTRTPGSRCEGAFQAGEFNGQEMVDIDSGCNVTITGATGSALFVPIIMTSFSF